MSQFTLAGETLNVNSFSGFDLPDDITSVVVLSNGTSDHNTVLQAGSKQSPTASISGRTSDFEQVALLRLYRESHASVEFVEPDEGAHTVVVLTLEVHKVSPTLFLWEWSATLSEVGQSVGSGSGS